MKRILISLVLMIAAAAHAAEPKTIELWPGVPPGDKGGLGEERDTTKPTDNMVAGKSVIRLGNVSKPSLAFYPAPKEKNTGATVVIFPGGAYNILAMDLEGAEVAEWLNTIGVNAAVVKYRVPRRSATEPHAAPVQDAQRAMRLVRKNAAEWGLDETRVGALGFSAGGNLAAALASAAEDKTYDKADVTDDLRARPDFLVLIYPAYLSIKEENDKIAPMVAIKEGHPKTFVTITEDDPVRVEGALTYYSELKKAKVEGELHIYPKGGHGYGLRKSKDYVSTWPDRVADWMRYNGWIERAK